MNKRKPKRDSLEIKKQILENLKKREMTFRELERKVDTNPNTIKIQVKELEYFGFVKTIKYEKNKFTGRPYTIVKLK